ncbi:MAG TPA: 30S ribosomal protein S16 [Candidatus Omnitrophota bacterium]|nr:30S ribosomal protein S16 [Candidatus Omnitrophota bacterium]HPB67429.1 30S ribosomal protein S16 [Candidatus Omnitrophota bacterium]HQO58088.1 30S ribosomal protein S16 [Candidatus Omnitrophota bacterium]HQP12760.1 30S ribosomal protein S16 [Candidatus Omnitrophota bacterium]
MEVRIRLQKAGAPANKKYNYRIVVLNKSDPKQGRAMDILGYYDPAKKPAVISLNKEKLEKWLKKGAQMTDTVRTLVKKAA